MIVNGRLQDDVQIGCKVSGGSASVRRRWQERGGMRVCSEGTGGKTGCREMALIGVYATLLTATTEAVIWLMGNSPVD